MSKNLWISLIATIVILISIALVLLLILVPQSSEHLTGVSYNEITKSDYTYVDNKYDPQKAENWEMHEVNASDIRNGKVEGTYVPGNTNPFTPPEQITIYNEPGFVDKDGNTYVPEGSTSTNNGSTSGGSSNTSNPSTTK